MADLGIKIDTVAALRRPSEMNRPDPVAAALLAEMAGADAIVCRLQEDRRQIQERDLLLLRKTVQSKLILEMATSSEMVGIALEVRPDQITLVPENAAITTANSGLDFIVHNKSIEETIGALQNNDIPVGVLISPEPDQIKMAHQAGADIILLHTGNFCRATAPTERHQLLAKIVDSAKLAKRLKLGIIATSDLCHQTIKSFQGLPEIDAYHIGHSIISRAIMVGMDRAVREMRSLISEL